MAALLSMLADAAAFAFFADVSLSVMLADGGAFALFAPVSVSAMLADAAAFAFFAGVSLSAMLTDAATFACGAVVSDYAMLAKFFGIANGAIFLQLVVWAFLTDPSHFSSNQPNLRQVLSVVDFFFFCLVVFIKKQTLFKLSWGLIPDQVVSIRLSVIERHKFSRFLQRIHRRIIPPVVVAHWRGLHF